MLIRILTDHTASAASYLGLLAMVNSLATPVALVVLGTGPGNPPAAQVLTGGSVQFGSRPGQNVDSVSLGWLLPGPDINGLFFGRVGTGPWFHFAVPTTVAKLLIQLSI
jgi:hypothetical protein